MRESKKHTLSDIAKLAGVSVSAVSKCLNGNPGGIPAETQEKIRQVANQVGYIPIRKNANNSVPSNLVGVIVPSLTSRLHAAFLDSLTRRLGEDGLLPVVTVTDYDVEKENKAVAQYLGASYRSLVAFPSSTQCIDTVTQYGHSQTAILLLNHQLEDLRFAQCYFDYESAAEQATEYLLNNGRRHIALIDDGGSSFVKEEITKGHKKAYGAAWSEARPLQVTLGSPEIDREISQLLYSGTDAVLCESIRGAWKVYQVARERCYHIPNDLSVICLEGADEGGPFAPQLTTVSFSHKELADHAAAFATANAARDSGAAYETKIAIPGKLAPGKSVARETSATSNPIVVVGRLNMDIHLRVAHRLEVGKTLSATNTRYEPGGKGGNQAVGVAKLGGAARLIGVLGNDANGKKIIEQLRHVGVDTTGVEEIGGLSTGVAYVHTLPDGKSLIIGDAGANGLLDREYVRKYESLFDSAGYCLYQMESDLATLEFLLELCQRKRVRPILKPHENMTLPQSLYAYTHTIVPNARELTDMVPQGDTAAEKAQLLVSRGIPNVVVTMGEQGCIWASEGMLERFPATSNTCVDATGASDVFISCLAVMLSEGRSMSDSVKMANCAAGFSVSWWGVQNAIPDRWTVENSCLLGSDDASSQIL